MGDNGPRRVFADSGTAFAYLWVYSVYLVIGPKMEIPGAGLGAFGKVVQRNRKTVLILTAVVLCGGALAALRGQPDAEKAVQRPLDNSSGLLAGGDFGTRELFFKTMLAVLLVAGLGAAAIYASRKLLPRISNVAGREIRIVETAHLGPRKAVHLVKIGNQRLLIGSTSERITMLAHLTDEFAEGSSFGVHSSSDTEPGTMVEDMNAR
jgi:flagellar biosynthetic protein FliO